MKRVLWIVATLSMTISSAINADNLVIAGTDNGGIFAAEWSSDTNAFGPILMIDRHAYSNPRTICAGDFNNDGHLDVMAMGWLYNRAFPILYLNDGANLFSRQLVPPISGVESYGGHCRGLATGDLNNDGFLDVVVSWTFGACTVMLNHGDGSFSHWPITGLGGQGRAVDLADFDGDGHLDLVRTRYSDGFLEYFQGNGDGTFTSPVFVADVGDDPYGLVAGDFNRDGFHDILTNGGSSGTSTWFAGNGDGTFAPGVLLPVLDLDSHAALDATDYNGDGILDIVMTRYSSNGTLHFFAGTGLDVDGNPTFAAPLQLGTLDAYALGVAAPPAIRAEGAPLAVISPATQTILAGTAATFAGNDSDDDVAIVSHIWSFGDGTADQTAETAPGNAVHTYIAEGIYHPTLTVTDGNGTRHTAAAIVRVTNQSPTVPAANVPLDEASIVNGSWPRLLQVDDFAGDDEGIATYSWSFDDDLAFDFESATALDGWYPFAGEWTVDTVSPISGSASLLQTNTTLARTDIMFNEPIGHMGQDVTIEVDLQLIAGTGEEAILLLGGIDEWASHEIIFRGRTEDDLLIRTTWYNSSRQYADWPLGFDVQKGVTYRLRVELVGQRCTVYVDGRLIGEALLYDYPEGRIGLTTYSGSAKFDNLSVTRGFSTRVQPNNFRTYSFEDGTLADFTPETGEWTISSSNPLTGSFNLLQSNLTHDRAAIVGNVVQAGDYAVSADIRNLAGYGDEFIFLLDYQNSTNLLEVHYRGRGINDVIIYRKVNNSNTNLGTFPLPVNIIEGATYRAQVVRRNGFLEFYIDDQAIGFLHESFFQGGKVGIATYDSSWQVDNLKIGPPPLLRRFNPGTTTATVSVQDAVEQSAVGTVTFSSLATTAPVADAGPPQSVDEISGNVQFTGYAVTLDGTASTDLDTASNELIWQWDMGTDTFAGTELDHGKWSISPVGVAQNNGLSITGNNSWGATWFGSRAAYARADGLVLEATLSSTTSSMGMIGFKNDTDTYYYNNLAHCIYFNTGRIEIYEAGSNRGTAGTYAYDTVYDIRIEVKPGGGARYLIRPAGTAEWTLLKETSTGTTSPLRRSIDVYRSTFTLTSFSDIAAGAQPVVRLYGAGQHLIELAVTDPSGNQDSDTVTITTASNAPPVANAGSDVVQDEADATDSVWTVNVSASASSDDHGIWMYEWDWDYDDAVFHPLHSGVSGSHQWTQEGVYTVALRVTDHAGLQHLDPLTVTLTNGVPPVARPGGPYLFTEVGAPAERGAWTVSLDGSASSDPDSSIVNHLWYLGVDDFAGSSINETKWAVGSGTTGGDMVTIVNTANTNGTHYLVSHDSYSRGRAMAMEWRQKVPGAADVFTGFKTDSTDYAYAQWTYSFRINNGILYVYERGTQTNTGVTLTYDTWYDFRVELKSGAGALYSYRATGDGPWVPLVNSTRFTDATFRRGVCNIRGTTLIDDISEIAVGATPIVRMYEPAGIRQISLTVTDQGLNTHTTATTVQLSYGQPPVADVGPDRTADETGAVQNTWTITFSAAGSTDDNGIWKYDWDWNYLPENGFQPSGDSGSIAAHTFLGAGSRVVALRVTDHLNQTDIDTATVTLTAGQTPVAIAGSDFSTEIGWLTLFDGGQSTDDEGVSRFEWDFGDGSLGSGRRPSHIYRTTGDYEVSLTVYDGAGQESAPDTLTVSVVTSTIPVASAGGPYTGGQGGPPVYLDASASHDNLDPTVQQGIVKYLWDMDVTVDSDSDGDPANDLDASGMRTAFTYAAAGTYQVQLTVVDGAGQSATDLTTAVIDPTATHEVLCVPWRGDPNAAHAAISGNTATLKGMVRGSQGVNYTYQWDFGDGSDPYPLTPAAVTNRRAIQATHAYTGSAGKPFTAVLTVWDPSGVAVSDNYYLRLQPDTSSTRGDIAVDEGLWYLHKSQQSTGAWTSTYSSYHASCTASVLHAFEINGHGIRGDWHDDPYVETVNRGFDFLFTKLIDVTIGMQTAGNPDTNGNGIGVSVNSSRQIYELGQLMDAIASSQSPLAVARTGVVKGRLFFDILTDMVDMYAWGQTDSGTKRGGWRYSWNSDADNSAAQWGAIGLLAAEENFGIRAPDFVRTENDIWLTNSSNGTLYGYSGANSYSSSGWYAPTVSGMVQLAFNGVWHTTSRWRASEDYIAAAWPLGGNDYNNYYYLYAFVKTMRTARPNAIPVFRHTGVDWYNDPDVGVRAKVVREQQADGKWYRTWDGSSSYIGYDLSTAWAIVMLTPTLFVQPPVAVIDAPPIWGYGQPLHFNGSRSYHTDSTRAIIRYEWDFDGNGTWDFTTSQATDPGATYTYPDPNPEVGGDLPTTFLVRLRVTDDNLPPQTDTIEFQLVVAEPPHAPYARISGPDAVTQGITRSFDGSASFDIDPGDRITLYEWDVNNDGVAEWSGADMSRIGHAFSTIGFASIALRVTDNGVLNDDVPLVSEWEYLRVQVSGNLAPVSRPGGPYLTYAYEPLTVDGSASSDPNGDSLSFAWDLDDDSVTDVATASFAHTWTEAGIYTLTLAVSDSVLANTETTTVTVLPNHLLTVSSTPVSGLLISGSQSGTTGYSVRVHDQETVTLTAPEYAASGLVDYRFLHWQLDGADMTAGQTSISFQMLQPHACVAVYGIVPRQLTVQSSPGGGVIITGTPGGSTPYLAVMDDHGSVSLSAPLTATFSGNAHRFVGWLFDGQAQDVGVTSLTFNIEEDVTVTAQYEIVTHLLQVDSAPWSVIEITGTHPGTTPYARTIADGTSVSLTAPSTANDEIFLWWENASHSIIDPSASIAFTARADSRLLARYTLKHDLFTDNARGAMWYGYTDPADPIHLLETDERLELRATAEADNDARYVSRGWMLNAEQSFMMQVDWHLDAPNANDAGLSFGIAAGASDSVELAVGQTSGDGAIYKVITQTAGNEPTGTAIARSTTGGTLYMGYDASTDSLYLSVNGYWRTADPDNGDWVLQNLLQSPFDPATQAFVVYLNGWSTASTVGPSTAWFDDFLLVSGVTIVPPVRELAVSSFPITEVPVTVSPADNTELLGAPTSFTRTYDIGFPVKLSVPAVIDGYAFSHWEIAGEWTTGQQTVNLVMADDIAAVAHYAPTRLLTVESLPVSGVAISGTHPGATAYSVIVADGATVNLEAPASLLIDETDYDFVRWIVNETSQPEAVRSLNLALAEDTLCTAEYAVRSTVATPTFLPDGGSYAGVALDVVVTCATPGAVIHYTTDGSEPTEASPSVASGGTISVDLPGQLKARAWRTPWNPSSVKSAQYNQIETNDPPVAVDDSYTVDEDVTLVVAEPGVLSNDWDNQGQNLTVSLVTGVTTGTLTLSANGSFTYVPAAGFDGIVTFTYRAFDGQAYSAPATVTITVTDIREVVSVTAIDDSAHENGESGTFRITRTGTNSLPLTVLFSLGGSADNGVDYATLSSPAIIPAGAWTVDLVVSPLEDGVYDPLETVILALLPDPAYDLGSSTAATVTIDDALPSLSIAGTSVTEGDIGVTIATIAITLDEPNVLTTTVSYRLLPGTATAGEDYIDAAGMITFPPGSTSHLLDLSIITDEVDEADETFFVELHSPVSAAIGTAMATVTILNDDIAIVSTANARAYESTGSGTVTVELSLVSSFTVTVPWQTLDGNGTQAAVAPQDYSAANGTLIFAPGETSKEITLTIVDDDTVEGDESFLVQLGTPVNAIAGTTTAIVTIVDNDVPTILVEDISVWEPGSGTLPDGEFVLMLSEPSPLPVTVSYHSVEGTATPDEDYESTSGTLTFAPYAMTVTVTVRILHDTWVEGDEQFDLVLTNAVNASLDDDAATCTILDNDTPRLQLVIAPTTFSEADGPQAAIGTVTRNSLEPLTCTLASSDTSEATVPSTLLFAANQTSATFAISAQDDTLIDGEQQVTIVASATSYLNAVFAVTVTSDDQPHNIVYTFNVRGNRHGGYAGPVDIAGYLIFDLDNQAVTILAKGMDGSQTNVTYADGDAIWFNTGTQPSDFWSLTNRCAVTMLGPGQIAEYAHLAMVGVVSPSLLDLGGAATGLAPQMLSGLWTAGRAIGPTSFASANAQARIDLARTRAANSAILSHAQLVEQLAAEAGITITATASAPELMTEESSYPGGPLVLYNSTITGYEVVDGIYRQVNYPGYLLVDFGTSEVRLLKAKVSERTYTIDDLMHGNRIRYTLQLGTTSYRFLGSQYNDEQSSRFWLANGRRTIVTIRPNTQVSIPLTLAGDISNHYQDCGNVSQLKLQANVRGETLLLNATPMSIDAAMDWVEQNLVPGTYTREGYYY